jgi:subtilase family serine protease
MPFICIRRFAAAGALALAYALCLPAQAGFQHPGAIPAERVEQTTAATAHFTCELRPFDLSKGLFCYGPAAIRSAYNLAGMIDSGLNGAGQTIVILDAFGSPTVKADLDTFDALFGLPAPPSFTVVRMPGLPPFDLNNGNMLGWAEETSLDVQWAHAIAPGANIVLVEAASNSDDDLVAGLNYALDHRLGNVVSMSFGESEASLTDADGQRVVAAWEAAFKKARQQRVTLFVSSGDQGSTNIKDDAGNVFNFQNVSYPASSPQVTGVGGTNLFFGTGGHADPNGAYVREVVWNDGFGAGGGGVSQIFGEPDFQREGLPKSVQTLLGGQRGIPDVSYNAGVVGGVIVRLGFFGGFFIFGGTSAGAPQWAGITADLNQAAGGPLGFINKRLYRAGKFGVNAALFHDVTVGDNSWDDGVTQVPGFPALPGFDLSTGYGTPNFGAAGTIFSDPGDEGHPNG